VREAGAIYEQVFQLDPHDQEAEYMQTVFGRTGVAGSAMLTPRLTHDQNVRATAGWGGLFRYARAAFRFVTNAGYRSRLMLRWRKPRNLFQVNNCTRANRYPVLFRCTREMLGDGPDLRLLSFGCATGEEVFTLREYFPNATIKGIDINPHNISVCRQRLAENPDPRIGFELADSVSREPVAAYDAIFCLAVFRHGDLAHGRFVRCDNLIRFADFCGMVEDIARRLKPGGLLLIMHANFRFRDTPTADEFELACRINLSRPGGPVTPIFDSENRRTNEVNCGEVMFRKKPAKAAD
jgi:SAM-dependent methyltransferase